MDDNITRSWDTLRLQVASQDGTTRTKDQLRRTADCVRALMVLNEELRLRNQLATVTSHAASDDQWETYSTIVDSLDEREGLNSYADVIISQTTGLRNEGKSWKSTLTADCAYSLIRNDNSELLNFEGTSDWYQDRLCTEDEIRCPNQQIPTSRMKEKGPSSNYLPDYINQVGSAGNRCISSLKQNVMVSEQFCKKSGDAPENEDHRHPKAIGSSCQDRRVLQNGHEPKFSWKQRETMYWKEKEVNPSRKPDFSNSGLTFGKHKTSEPESSDFDKGRTLFKTAKEQYIINQRREGKKSDNGGDQISANSYGTTKKSLGTRRGPSSRFVPPIMRKSDDGSDYGSIQRTSRNREMPTTNGTEEVDDRLKNIDPKMIELIESEIMDHGPPIHWDDIAGLEFAKSTIQEIVVWPMLRPDIFHGLRGPPKGLLLFGPPGTGKTLIGKCIASQSHATFFSISASSLTSKWVGEGEKMVRALFAVARCHSPAVIFIDEIDSLLTQRMDGEHESSRRIKTEFLVQLDGTTTKAEERFLVIGATNRPQELDEAARRRLVKRLYIPLPEPEARKQIVKNLMREQKANLNEENYSAIMNLTCGYSGADMSNLCREAALGPIRSIAGEDIRFISTDEVRSIEFADFQEALKYVRPSVCDNDLEVYIEWNRKFGSGTGI